MPASQPLPNLVAHSRRGSIVIKTSKMDIYRHQPVHYPCSRGRMPFEQASSRRSRESAFTIVELLVVTVIIMILMTLVLRFLPVLRDQSNRAVCTANLRSLSVAISAYSSGNSGAMPSNNSKTSWWKEIYPDYCSTKSVFACPEDRTGFTDPEDIEKGKLSYGPLGWDGGTKSASAFNKQISTFTSPERSIVLSEYFSTNRSVDAMRAWNYPGTVGNAAYPHHMKTKASILFLDGHIECVSEADIRERIKDKEIINSF